MMKNLSGVLKGINEKRISRKKATEYESSGLLKTVHNSEDVLLQTEKLFKIAQKSLATVNFNEKKITAKLLLVVAMAMNTSTPKFDETCELMKKIAAESDLRECGKKFVQSLNLSD